MIKRLLIALGVLVVVAAVLGLFMIFPSDEGIDKTSNIEILGNGTIGVNGTLNVKLSSGDGVALKDKTVHVSVKDQDGNVVFEDSAQTRVNGVANIRISDVSAGEYEVNVTFDGDNNYTGSSIVKKLIIDEGVVEEDTSDEGADDGTDETADDGSSQSQSSSSSYRYNYNYNYNSNGNGASNDASPSDSSDGNGEASNPSDSGTEVQGEG